MGRAATQLGAGPGRRAVARAALAAAACIVLANCNAHQYARVVDPKFGVAASPRVIEPGQPVPRGGGFYRVGDPYVVAGRTYVPQEDPSYRAEGIASWYGIDFHGRKTANGEIYDMDSISAAHPTLPIPSYARVTNLANKRSIIVRINDRGPFKEGRVIDLSARTAELLAFKKYGVARVRVEYVGPASLKGSDDRVLMATLRSDGRDAPPPSPVLVASASNDLPESMRPRPATIPQPPERPFALGEGTYVAAVPASDPTRSSIVASAPPRVRPAFVAAEQTGPGLRAGILTGRGLY